MTSARWWLEKLASVRLAVATMTALAVVCGAATVYESRWGTPAAQRVVYRSPWFALLLGLLALNVLVSMLKRWPWKTQHTGFVLAHVGILLLLAGSLTSLRFGLDGSLALAEGESSAVVVLPARDIEVTLASGVRVAVPLRHVGEFWGEERHQVANQTTLVLSRHQPHVSYHETVVDAPSGSPVLEYHFEGEGLERQAGWLLADDEEHARGDFGPVQLIFLTATAAYPATTLLAAGAGESRGFFVNDGSGSIRYALSSRNAATMTGVVSEGAKLKTPWMALTIVIDRVRPSARLERHLAAERPPQKESERLPAVEVRLDQGARVGKPEWIAAGETREIADPEGGSARVSFGDATTRLPFRVTLLQFRSQKYPGTTMAATYESQLRIDDPEQGSFDRLVAMNRPLHHRGYTLFQASYAEGVRMTSVLAVSRAPGLPLVYAGTALLVLGAAWMFYLKPWLARRRGARALHEHLAAARAIALVAAAFVLTTPVLAEDVWSGLREVPVQDAGRIKPLDTFARESARRFTGARVFGAESVEGMEPVEWLVSAWASPDRWRERPIIHISDASLRASLELPPDRDRFSLAELAGSEALRTAVEKAREQPQDGDASLQAANHLYDDLLLLDAILEGNVPQLRTGESWLSTRALRTADEPAAQEARIGFLALIEAHRAGDTAAVAVCAKQLAGALAPSHSDAALFRSLGREVRYNALKPFRAAWILYLAALGALLASSSLGSRKLTSVGYALMVGGLAMHSYGLLVRAAIAGRAPVTNMYESIVFAAWGAVALGLAFTARHGAKLFAASAAGIAVPFLLIADGVPIFDSAIEPLAPVLRDNFWLTSHVLTITLGYAALFLALALGHVSLALQLRGAGEARVRRLSGFLLQVIQAGTLLLAAGTLLGGVWASYSWGRFWGWDPKETWALIAVLVYLALLHSRFAGWLHDAGLAAGSIVGGLSVLMAWYGVNYVLGTGLHSYGFGSGGANSWVLGFALVEAALVVVSLWRLGGLETRPAAAHNEPAAIAH